MPQTVANNWGNNSMKKVNVPNAPKHFFRIEITYVFIFTLNYGISKKVLRGPKTFFEAQQNIVKVIYIFSLVRDQGLFPCVNI